MKPELFARISLSFLWITTGLTSLFAAPEIGYDILAGAGISGSLADLCVWGGSLLDITLGIWIISGVLPALCIRLQIATILIYSLLLTFIAPEFWLHPFGPLTKNLPILTLLILLLSRR